MKDLIWIIDAYINTEEKEQMTIDLIKNLRTRDGDIAIVSHLPISKTIQEMVDYTIYDKNNLFINWGHEVFYMFDDLKICFKKRDIYHGLAIYMNRKNACDLFADRYKLGNFIEYDFNIKSLTEYIEKTKDFLFKYDVISRPFYSDPSGKTSGILTDLYTVNLSWANKILPYVDTAEDYMNLHYGYMIENLLYNLFLKGQGEIKFIEMERIINSCSSDNDNNLIVLLCDTIESNIIAAFIFNQSNEVKEYFINDQKHILGSQQWHWSRLSRENLKIITDNKEYIIEQDIKYNNCRFIFSKSNMMVCPYWTESDSIFFGLTTKMEA